MKKNEMHFFTYLKDNWGNSMKEKENNLSNKIYLTVKK